MYLLVLVISVCNSLVVNLSCFQNDDVFWNSDKPYASNSAVCYPTIKDTKECSLSFFSNPRATIVSLENEDGEFVRFYTHKHSQLALLVHVSSNIKNSLCTATIVSVRVLIRKNN